MENINEKNLNITELKQTELSEINGGLLPPVYMIVGSAIGVGLIAAAGYAIYGSFKSGVNQACGCGFAERSGVSFNTLTLK